MSEDLARQRWKKMQWVRISGIVCLLLGLAVAAGKVDLPPIVGLLLMILGAFDILILPVLMARRWKSPPQ